LMYPRAAELFPVDFELDINKLPKSWSIKRFFFFLFLVIAATELLELDLSIFLTSLEELKCDSNHCGPQHMFCFTFLNCNVWHPSLLHP
jgi:hypothetical protein